METFIQIWSASVKNKKPEAVHVCWCHHRWVMSLWNLCFLCVRTVRPNCPSLRSPSCCDITAQLSGCICAGKPLVQTHKRYKEVTWPDFTLIPGCATGGPSTLWWGGLRWRVWAGARGWAVGLLWAECSSARRRWFPVDWTSGRPPVLHGPRLTGRQTGQISCSRAEPRQCALYGSTVGHMTWTRNQVYTSLNCTNTKWNKKL